MPATQTASSPRRAITELREALGRNDLAGGERAVSELKQPYPPEALELVGVLHMMRQRWVEAAETLGRMRGRSTETEVLRRYSANLAALQEYRQGVYEAVMAAPESGRYEIDQKRMGLGTVLRVGPNGRRVPVVLGGSPQEHVASVERLFDGADPMISCFCLAGIGDGNVLAGFVKRYPPGVMGLESPLVVIEPDAELVRAVLLLHDLSQEDGPIRQQRVSWFVGPQWQQQLEKTLHDDPYQLPPSVVAGLTQEGSRLILGLQKLCQRVEPEVDLQYQEALREYESRSPGEWAAIVGQKAGRKPRVLLVTCRFTTVLQHATQDAAEAFGRLGWEVQVMIEPAAHKRLTQRYLRRVISTFRPDLVFMVDHLRKSLPGRIPQQLPFVCWIQDDLNQLTEQQAGRSVGGRDYVITCAPVLYSRRFGYPLQQCIYADKLTRVPRRPAAWTSDGDDLVFVSHASRSAEQIVEELKREIGNGESGKSLMDYCCGKIVGVYESGGVLYNATDVLQIVNEACSELGLERTEQVGRTRLALRLFNSLNNTLYRQQAIGWAAEVSKQLGLRLAMYGSGWEKNPRFSEYARGQVAYGQDLEELTRRAKINLQIVPFSCLHQRLLDGLAAGGFYLIRDHPVDRLRARMAGWLAGLDPAIGSVPEARGVLKGQALREMEELLELRRRLLLDADGDPIVFYRQRMAQGCDSPYQNLPRLDEVGFSSQATLHERVRLFLADARLRREVADEQRRFVETTQTYEAGLKRATQQIANLLQQESAVL